MATICVDVAQELMEKLRVQKRSRVYCVVRYHNAVFNKQCWAYFNNKQEYDFAINSGNVQDLNVMWWSDRYTKDFLRG